MDTPPNRICVRGRCNREKCRATGVSRNFNSDAGTKEVMLNGQQGRVIILTVRSRYWVVPFGVTAACLLWYIAKMKAR